MYNLHEPMSYPSYGSLNFRQCRSFTSTHTQMVNTKLSLNTDKPPDWVTFPFYKYEGIKQTKI